MSLRLSKSFLAVGTCALVLSPFLLFSYPKKASAEVASCVVAYIGHFLHIGGEAVATALSVPVNSILSNTINTQTALTNTQLSFSQCILRPLAIIMAQRMLANITNNLVTWIQSGFNGKPAFVTNIDDLLNTTANQAIGSFIESDKTLSFLCEPFSLQVRIALATEFSDKPYNGCTLTDIDKNIKNFGNGNTEQAWQNWLNISTIPANNQFGAYVELSSQLGDQINAQVKKVNNEIQRNLGFLDYKVCDGWSSDEETDQKCLHYKTSTPGATVEGAIVQKFGSDFSKLGLATDMDQIIGALVNTLVDKAITGPGGLLGAKTQSVKASTDLSALAASNPNNSQTIDTLNNQILAATPTNTSANQINLSLTATIHGSSAQSGSDAKNAIDNDPETTFISGNENSPSLTIDLGSSKNIGEIQITGPYPIQETLGKISVIISNSANFGAGDPSTSIWDSTTNNFVSMATAGASSVFNATSSPIFDIIAQATGQYIKITKHTNTTQNTDPLQITDIFMFSVQ